MTLPSLFNVNGKVADTCALLASDINSYIVPVAGLDRTAAFACVSSTAFNATISITTVCTTAYSTQDAAKLAAILELDNDLNPNSFWPQIFSDIVAASVGNGAICSVTLQMTYGCLPPKSQSTPACAITDIVDYPFCSCDRRPKSSPMAITDVVSTTAVDSKTTKYCFTVQRTQVALNPGRCANVQQVKKVEFHADYAKRGLIKAVTANGVKATTSWGKSIVKGVANYDTFKVTELFWGLGLLDSNPQICITLDTRTFNIRDFCIQDPGQLKSCAVALFDPSQNCCPTYTAN